MKKIISLALLTFSLPSHSAPAAAAADDAAIAAHAAQAKKTSAEEAEYAKSVTLSKIESAIAKKNIGLVAQLLPALSEEFDQYQVFTTILDLDPTNLTRQQLDILQKMTLNYQKEFGKIPQDFTIPEMQKKWSTYLPKVYAAAEHEAKSASQKPAAPRRPAPRRLPLPSRPLPVISTIQVKSSDGKVFSIPYDIAINPNIAGSLIHTNIEGDRDIREGREALSIPYTSDLLGMFVGAWRASAQSKDGNLYTTFIDTFKPLPIATQIELMKVADYLGADTALKALAVLFAARSAEVDSKILGQLPRTIQAIIEDIYKTAHKKPLTVVTLVAQDGTPVPGFDRLILMNENIVGSVIGKLVKNNSTHTRLPVGAELLKKLQGMFSALYEATSGQSKSVDPDILLKTALKIFDQRDWTPEDLMDFQKLNAKPFRDALILKYIDLANRSSDNPARSIAALAPHLVPFMPDLASEITHFNADEFTPFQEALIMFYIGKNLEIMDKSWLAAQRFPWKIQEKISKVFNQQLGRPIPQVSPAREKKEKAASRTASPPPPSESDEVIPLERRSGSGSGAKSPDSEAAAAAGKKG